MLNQFSYEANYPVLAQFAKEDPTYTRRSKTGKMVVVRKGKRKSKILPIVGALGGLHVGGKVGDAVSIATWKKAGIDPAKIGIGEASKQYIKDKGLAKGGILAGSGLAIMAAGSYGGYKLAKKFRDRND